MKKENAGYENLDKSELIQRIAELEEVVYQMNKNGNQKELVSLPWVGNLGHWHWMVNINKVIFNEKKITNLGYGKDEIPEEVGFEFFTDKLHPDDYERVMENMKMHLLNLSDAYEVEYRIRDKNGNYAWYYDRGQIVNDNDNKKGTVVSGIVFDISKNKIMEEQLRETNERLQKLVITDELTGAFNRRLMLERMNNEIQRFNRTNLCFSLIMLDVDNFKRVNDDYGHIIGDTVLKELVHIILKRIRVTDVLARWGGEEFVILLPDTKLENAVILAEDIKNELSKMNIPDVGKVTASFGVSEYCHGDNINNAIKKVDDLMYKAKSDGKNLVRY